MTKHST